MLTAEQVQDFARFLALDIDQDAGEAEMYADEITATRDAFRRYVDGTSWSDAGTAPEMLATEHGVPVVHRANVQASPGQPHVELYVADFGSVRGIYQI